MTTLDHPPAGTVRLYICGEPVEVLPEGALWWAPGRALIVADLHLEKASSYARRGQMLPPYDTALTLSRLEEVCRRLRPDRVVSLGDSFHDRGAEVRLAEADGQRIRALTSACDWVWVEGNHDPTPPAWLGGRGAHAFKLGALVLRHEPEGERGEIAGHLHPVVRIRRRGRSVRRACFASDGERLVMPAFGALTGGLNVCDPAFAAIFSEPPMAFALGQGRVFAIAPKHFEPDQPRTAQWRL